MSAGRTAASYRIEDLLRDSLVELAGGKHAITELPECARVFSAGTHDNAEYPKMHRDLFPIESLQ